MRVLKTILDFYISSSIHVAFAVYALSWLTLLKFGLAYDRNVLCFIFFATITGYNFVKFFGLAKFHHRRLTTWLKSIQVVTLLCFVLMVYFAFYLELNTLLVISIFAGITFLYAMPLLPKHLFMDNARKLRSIGGLKVYVIAVVWAGVTVGVPLLNANYIFNESVAIIGIQRFFLVLALMLPFEIRDLKYDSLKLATIPQKIGVNRTKWIGVVLLMLVVGLEVLLQISTLQSIVRSVCVAMISAIFIGFSKVEQHRYYSGFFVESIPISWLLMALTS